MGRAIIALSAIFVCSVAFVLLHLWLRKPEGAAAASARPAPVLDVSDDGSIYAVRLRIEQFERRLMEEERRSGRLMTELERVRKERDTLEGRVDDLQDQLDALRRRAPSASRQNAPAEAGNTSQQPAQRPPAEAAPAAPPGG